VTDTTLPPEPPSHYRDGKERLADLIVHLTGLALALVGGGMLLGLAIGFGHVGRLTAAAIYAVGLLTMLALSTAYNFAAPRFQPLLRRFDHAGIFLFGVMAKLLLPGLGKGFWIVVYLALGWLMVIAVQPIMQSLGLAPLILMAVGGLLYSVGVIFYANKAMRYRRAIWHGHVVVAAAVHWVAVLLAVRK
jgi:hemolysin III